MSRAPKIVGESRKKIRVIPPPPRTRIINPIHGQDGRIEVYFSRTSMTKLITHCRNYADKKLEVMGFLMGDVFRWKDRMFALVKDAVTTDLESTSISVRFNKEGFPGLFSEMDKLDYNYIIVGWYHSHPGMGCFLSTKDIETQKRMFNKPYHIALVVDPLKKEMKAYKMRGSGYVERKLAVYDVRITPYRKADKPISLFEG
jgi:proteasome lid subunit RPN8/RPN11